MAKRKVLIVCDEASAVSGLQQRLRSTHPELEFQSATSGTEALRLLEHHEYDLIAADNEMADMRGVQLLGRVADSGLRIPAVLFVSELTERLDEEARGRGAVAVLRKPLDLDLLSEAVHKGLNGTGEGRLHGISLPGFLQLLEMESKTVRLRISFEEEEAVLYLSQGEVVHARWGDLRGDEAATRIVRWDPVSILMKGDRWRRPRTVRRTLTHLLLQAAKTEDEQSAGGVAGPSRDTIPIDGRMASEPAYNPVAVLGEEGSAKGVLEGLTTLQGILAGVLLSKETGRCWTYGEMGEGRLDEGAAASAAALELVGDVLSRSRTQETHVEDLAVTLGMHYLLVRELVPSRVLLTVFDRRAVSLGLAIREVEALCQLLNAA